ncbi:MAG: type II toxin-antitoxin system RelE/ParE family toxin [Beijerinckiaceae bacterium]
MTHEIIFAPEAQADLLKLYDDIETNSGAERARDYTDRIIAQCLSLANFPARGRRRDDLRPDLRIISFRRRVTIAFHITATTVIIDHVLYGGRDLKPLFDEEDDD